MKKFFIKLKKTKAVSILNSPMNSKGIALMTALFMVLLITVIVNEISFETNIEYTVNSQAINRIKAYYAAKSGMELSKLRIRIYQKALNLAGDQLGSQAHLLDMIYSLPFAWPLAPVGDMNSVDIDALKKAVKEAKMDASYMTTIQTEDRLNINDLNSPVEAQKKKVRDKLVEIFKGRVEQDDEWAKNNRDLKYEEIINNIEDFLDPDTLSKNGGDESAYYDKVKDLDREADIKFPPNRWFQSIEELHMVPGITDEIYAFLSPMLTVFGPYGINPNHADKAALKSLHPTFTDEVVGKIMERRDNPAEGGPFQDAGDFFGFAVKSGARISEEDQAKVPLTFTSPCHFRIISTGNYGKVTVELTAVTYELQCQQQQLSEAITKQDQEKNPDPNKPPVDPNAKNKKSKKPALPKGPPRIVYWNER